MKYLLFALLLLTGPWLLAQHPVTLSDTAQISLLTVAPGEELYSFFGHSAVRVSDPVHRLDRCYNYGTFDFEQPNFYVNFCRGKLWYQIDAERWENFEYGNLHDRRAMQEQMLDLDKAQKQRLFDLLEENMQPANRNYKYEFFYDNCATRIRDIVRKAAYQITYDSAHVQLGATMRQLLRPYVARQPWISFGFDLILGMPTDKIARPEDYMFLPDYLHHVFAATRQPGGKPLVRAERNIPKNPLPPKEWKPGFLDRPFWMMCAIAVLGVLCMFHRRADRIFDFFFWFLLGVVGLIIALLWFATDHTSTKMNLNILWALPTHLLFFWNTRRTEWVENYFTATSMLALMALIFWAWLPQDMPIDAIPIVMLVIVKGFWRRYQ